MFAILHSLLVLVALLALNELCRKSRWITLAIFLVLPVFQTGTLWLENATRRVFRDGRPVVFNDSGTNQPALDLRSALRPGSVLVTNVSKAFTFAGEGLLEGPMSLTKGGAGTLSLLWFRRLA